MRIQLLTSSFRLSRSLKSFVRVKMTLALSPFEERFQSVIVRLSDTNGPRGGNDKRCHVQLIVDGMPNIVVEQTKGSMYAAIDRAIKKAVRALKEKYERKQSLLRLDRQSIKYLSTVEDLS